MSFSGFQTETQRMQAAATDVDQVSDQIKKLLDALGAEVASAPTHFRGAAAASFQQLMQRYDADAKQLQAALTGIASQLRAADHTYTASDQAQSAALTQSGSALNM
jgi:WXG100 family type VII secretion target